MPLRLRIALISTNLNFALVGSEFEILKKYRKSEWPKISVVAGSQSRFRGGQTFSVEQVTVNPIYDSKNVNNDIAILKVHQLIIYTAGF
jgi:hypothetical protein